MSMLESFFNMKSEETLEERVARLGNADWRGYETIEQLRDDLNTPGLMIGEPRPEGEPDARGRFMSGPDMAAVINDMLARKTADRVDELPDSSRGGLRSVVRALLETHRMR